MLSGICLKKLWPRKKNQGSKKEQKRQMRENLDSCWTGWWIHCTVPCILVYGSNISQEFWFEWTMWTFSPIPPPRWYQVWCGVIGGAMRASLSQIICVCEIKASWARGPPSTSWLQHWEPPCPLPAATFINTVTWCPGVSAREGSQGCRPHLPIRMFVTAGPSFQTKHVGICRLALKH